MENEEIWKDIKGYEGLYKVSNYGRVKSLCRKGRKKEGILNSFLHNSGYKAVALSKNGKSIRHTIHRLVAENFIPNPQNYSVINHIDGDKFNNNIENLEWCTVRHNVKESFRLGRKSTWFGKYGSEHCLSKPIIQYDLNKNFIRRWSCAKEVERKLGFFASNIRACCTGIRKTAYGYIWENIKNE